MKPQELQFELMKLASFNDFHGPTVVRQLKENADLWQACMMCRDGGSRAYLPDLIALRDLPRYWNVDTVYIIPAKGKKRELELLANGWRADEVSWLSEKDAGDALGQSPAQDVLRVWWD